MDARACVALKRSRLPVPARCDGSRCDRVLDASGVTGHAREVAAAALTGWIAFIREITVEWLLGQRISRTDVVDLCMGVLDVALGAEFDLTTAIHAGRQPG